MVTLHITNMINQLDIFKSTQNYKSITQDDYILQSSVIDFKQYFSEDLQSSYVKVEIKFSLIDNNSHRTIDSKTFSSVVNSEELDSYGGVKSLNKAFIEVLNDSSSWIEKICH